MVDRAGTKTAAGARVVDLDADTVDALKLWRKAQAAALRGIRKDTIALPIFFCDSQAMMVDRVKSLREANVYNLHYSRHVVSNVEILSARDDTFEVAACYTVYQTDLEGQTRLFSVGQYRDVIANGEGEFRFREKIAVCDTFNIPNLLAIPL